MSPEIQNPSRSSSLILLYHMHVGTDVLATRLYSDSHKYTLCLGQPEVRDWWPCSLKLDQLCEINQWKLPWQRKQGRLFLKWVVYCHFILECFTAGGAESLWQFIHVPRQFQSHTRRITNGALRTDPADTRRHMSRKHKSHRHSTTSWIKSEMNLFRKHM